MLHTDICVIKYGGNAWSDNDHLTAFARAVAEFRRFNKNLVLIHGGGPQINVWLEKTAINSHFVDGERYTDNAALEVTEMVLCGQVNKKIVRALAAQGIKAVGISGQDGGLLTAKAVEHLGQVGRISAVEPALIQLLLKNDYLPVIAPPATSLQFAALNVNADYAAARIAGALGAKYLILLTNVAGILDERHRRIPVLNRAKIQALKEAGIINGGMLPKTDCALNALDNGCQKVVILDGRSSESLSAFAVHPEQVGTQIVP